MKLSFVIPSFNERETLPQLIEKIEAICREHQYLFDICIVDDGSTDGSYSLLQQLRPQHANLHTIRFRIRSGKALALSTGFAQASGDIVIMMDADLQDDPADVPLLIAKINEGYDVVTGWKVNRQDPWHKTFPSKILNAMVRKFSGLRVHDVNCGLKAFKKQVISEVYVYGELYRYILVLAHTKGFRVTEVPTHHHPRTHGVSKFGASRFMKGFFDLLTVLFLGKYTRRPLHFFGFVGALMIFLGAIALVYLTIIHFLGSAIGNRPLLLFGVLFVLVGLQLFIVGFLAELLISNRKDHQPPIQDSF